MVTPMQSSGLGQACTQVLTTARHPITGEVREFPTPCDVPAGWTRGWPETGGTIQLEAWQMALGLVGLGAAGYAFYVHHKQS
jgi:hypothetical protein